MTLGHPTLENANSYESQQFGPAVPTAAGYYSQPAMYGSGNVVAWWQPYKDWGYNPHVHNGLDVAGPQGLPLYAMETGKVIDRGWRTNGGGYAIEVQVNAVTRYVYNHCSGFPAGLAEGQRVAKGQIIAFIGATGTATGNHCHVSLDIDERGPDGITRRLMWNPKLFMAGGPYANDPRIAPTTPAPAPAPIPSTYPSTEGNVMALRYRKESGTAVVRAGKPYRDRPTTAAAPLGYFAEDTPIRILGRPKEATGSFDPWKLTDIYRGNGDGLVWVTGVDFK